MITKKCVIAAGICVLSIATNSVGADQVIDDVSAGNPLVETSFASQIAHAANLTNVQDQEIILPAESTNGSRSATSRSLDLVMAGGSATGTFTSGAVSPGMGVSLWLISALLPSQGYLDIKAGSRLFVWMPIEMADSKDHAASLLASVYIEAVKKALPGHTIETIKAGVRNGGIGGISLKISGPKCPAGCIQPLSYIKDPEIGKAPTLLGGYNAYVWKVKDGKEKSNFFPQGKKFFPIGQEKLTKEERVDFYQELSAGLPEWVFLYIAPNEKASPVPVIYNMGTPNYFIKPANKKN
ncbi:MAG: hypothetical protein ABW076_00675 [Candidatus Thiodiazotropha sp.]